MELPLQIIFRNMESSPAIEDRVKKQAKKLEHYFDHIMSCRIAIEVHHRHQHKGKLYHVRIDLMVPNAELVVNREPAANHSHEDVYVAIRDAFDAMKKQLQNYTDKIRGEVKHHDSPLNDGYVVEIAPISDYGCIESSDGGRFHFSSNSVVNYDFKKLDVGDKVRFVPTDSHDGPAASTVYFEMKHR